ncbi:MAG TPA: hypothetical protein VMF32_23135 [Xanthobacteraceae bacterium]|nr:hypothetical protein [Xanthobacteraceae bacterium]
MLTEPVAGVRPAASKQYSWPQGLPSSKRVCCSGADRKAGEFFAMRQVCSIFADRFKKKVVLAIKNTGNDQVTQPTQLSLGSNRKDRWPKSHSGFARRAYADSETSTLRQCSGYRFDKWIPGWHAIEIGQNRPNASRRGIDVDIGFDPTFDHWVPDLSLSARVR